MSYQAVEWALSLEVPPTTKLVLVAMARRANKSGEDCYPGVQDLASVSGRSERTVQYELRRLEAWGIIECLENPQGGRGKKPSYRLALEKGATEVAERVQHTAPIKRVQNTERVQSVQERVQTATQKGAKRSNPIKEEAVLKRSKEAVQRYYTGFSALEDVPGFSPDAVLEAKAAEYFDRKGISPEQVEQAANAIQAKVWLEKGKWSYQTKNGKQATANLYGLLKSWAARPPLQSQNGPRASPNGARAGPRGPTFGPLSEWQAEQQRQRMEKKRREVEGDGGDDG